jgi:hypothetical protein
MKKVRVDVWYPRNIVEILKSGREPQLYCKPPNQIKAFYRTFLEIPVEEQKVTINETTFQIISKQIRENYPNNQFTADSILKDIKEKLGFEDE